MNTYCLEHPLVLALCDKKWNHAGVYFHMATLCKWSSISLKQKGKILKKNNFWQKSLEKAKYKKISKLYKNLKNWFVFFQVDDHF